MRYKLSEFVHTYRRKRSNVNKEQTEDVKLFKISHFLLICSNDKHQKRCMQDVQDLQETTSIPICSRHMHATH